MISTGHCAANAIPTAVLPTAVGPTSTGTLAAAKASLQLLTRQLHDGRAPVHVVRRELGREQPQQQLPHLALVEPLPGLDRRATGVRGREPFQPVGPAAEAPAREIGYQLLEAGAGVEPRVGRRDGVEHHRATAERLRLVPDRAERLGVPL